MISVIIPTLNEEKLLPLTLGQVLNQTGDYEVMVVDGGSVDRTCEIAEATRRVQVLRTPKGRAVQMNTGARVATGEWLLFVHADTLLPMGALAHLNGLETDTAIQAGGFMHQFSGQNWQLKLLSALNNIRCRWSRIIYGDQALFIRRTLFKQVGGFPEERFLEDVLFARRLVRITRPILLSPPVVTDCRKFVQMGIWRSVARATLLLLFVELHLPILSRTFFREVR
jgi:rSAM/selenodomain-associated transferase 2